MSFLSRPATLLALSTALAAGCGTTSVFVTPEGNIAIGPRNAATGAPGGPARLADNDRAPERHVSRSAFERWRPPPLGVLPPGNLLRNTSRPVTLRAGELSVVLRPADTRVPSWGGDTYVRVEIRAGGESERPPPRDLAVLIDTRDRDATTRARRIAAALFETLREGDRGALIATTEFGRVLVPLLSYGAAPLLIDRVNTFEQHNADDLDAALEHGVEALETRETARTRKLIVLSGSGATVSAEALEWMAAAQSRGIEVALVPLNAAAARRFERVSLHSQATVLPEVAATDQDEGSAVAELSALPEARAVARDLRFVVDAMPGPSHLIEVAGATPLWTPSGGEVPIGEVRAGDRRTLVLRAAVAAYRAEQPFDLAVTMRFTDEHGPHEARTSLHATYSGSPREYAGSRNGDVLQYVSLLNTLSNVQAALARRDQGTIESLRDAAELQARSLGEFGREHRDDLMTEQAGLLDALLRAPAAPWR